MQTKIKGIRVNEELLNLINSNIDGSSFTKEVNEFIALNLAGLDYLKNKRKELKSELDRLDIIIKKVEDRSTYYFKHIDKDILEIIKNICDNNSVCKSYNIIKKRFIKDIDLITFIEMYKVLKHE